MNNELSSRRFPVNLARNIHEEQPHTSHRVSALDPVDDASPDERYNPRQGRDARGGGINPGWGARPGPIAVRNAAAQRTTVGARHHARRLAPYTGHACDPRDG